MYPVAHENALKLELPTLAQWTLLLNRSQDARKSEIIRLSLQRFLLNVDLLAAEGCIPKGITESVRALIVETIPLQPQQSLYNFCEYWLGSGIIDLRPHLRLTVQRAYIRQSSDPEPNQITTDVSTIYVMLQTTRSGLLQLRSEEAKSGSGSPGSKLAGEARKDLHRFNSSKSMAVHRLILLTHFMSQDMERPALILSAQSSTALDKATVLFQAQPSRSCVEVEAATGILCTPFSGNVTVSPEIEIFDNGKSRYVPFGTTLASIIQERRGDSQDHSGVRLSRKFADNYCDVETQSDPASASSIVLVGGDQIRWTTNGRTVHDF